MREFGVGRAQRLRCHMIPKYHSDVLAPGFADVLREHVGLGASAPLTGASRIAEFARAHQIVTLWGGTELPSVQELATGELALRKPLIASPITAQVWAWTKELMDSQEFALVKLFRRRATIVARSLWPALVSVAQFPSQSRAPRPQLSTAARQIAEFLSDRGPLETSELMEALPRRVPILPESLRKGLEELEEKLVIYPKGLRESQRGKYAPTWELVRRGLAAEGRNALQKSMHGCMEQFVEGSVQAAGVVDASECSRWFPAWRQESLRIFANLRNEGSVRALENLEFSLVACSEFLAKARVLSCCS